MNGSVIPHIISVDQAADALGITVSELAQNISSGVHGRLTRLAADIESFEVGKLDDFDERVGDARRLFESLLACWDSIDGGAA